MKIEENSKVIIIGYSGHAYVVIETLLELEETILGYLDLKEKSINPYKLDYLGKEGSFHFSKERYIIAIGDNILRADVASKLDNVHVLECCIHPNARVSNTAEIGSGTFVSSGSVINALVHIGKHCIVNTSSVIEHESIIGDFVHIAPSAVLAGNVSVGDYSFIGANAVVKQGVKIGKNCTVGAGTVVINDISDGSTIVGNPARLLSNIN